MKNAGSTGKCLKYDAIDKLKNKCKTGRSMIYVYESFHKMACLFFAFETLQFIHLVSFLRIDIHLSKIILVAEAAS
jgi:hypothetical protein